MISSFGCAVLKTNLREVLFIILYGTSLSLSAQLESDSVNQRRLRTVIIGTAATYTVGLVGLNQLWYSYFDQESFHFFNDASEWKQVDKVGHMYSTFQLSHIGSRAFQWTNLSDRKSDWIGSLIGFGMVSSIEILDGFSTGYGASGSDLAANAIGSGLYIGQKLLWREIRVHPKYSFHRTLYPSTNPDLLGGNVWEETIKDYNGQTYWLSVDMDKFIRFPKWLNFSVGYGAEGMVYARDESNIQAGYSPYRQFYLGLDFDVTSIKSKSRAINNLLFFVNMIKIPGPTLEFSNGKVKGYLFYY